jgi:hypothetical protein
VLLELHGLKMRVDPHAAGSLQSAEQLIAPRLIFLNFGHRDTVMKYCKLESGPGRENRSQGPPSWAFIEGEELSVIEGRVNA